MVTFQSYTKNTKLIRLFQIYWSENQDMVALCSEDSFYVLRYDAEYDGEPDEVNI